MSTRQDIQKPAPGAIIELFELDATMLGAPSVYRFVNWANPLGGDVVWRGQTYTRYPVEAEGFELSGRGALPRPKLRVANANGLMGALAIDLDNLLGARLTRWRTFVHYLDAVNFPVAQQSTPGVLTFARSTTATYFSAAGVLSTAAVDQPRIDRDPVTPRQRDGRIIRTYQDPNEAPQSRESLSLVRRGRHRRGLGPISRPAHSSDLGSSEFLPGHPADLPTALSRLPPTGQSPRRLCHDPIRRVVQTRQHRERADRRGKTGTELSVSADRAARRQSPGDAEEQRTSDRVPDRKNQEVDRRGREKRHTRQCEPNRLR
ncbi:MAG: phage minor tail protein L [Thermomonas hydrothermalis]|nr:phage minor tail protein L [Thermomonas hydrothermalis]